MLDRYMEDFLKADATLLAMLGSLAGLGLYESDGTTPAANVWYNRANPDAVHPFILIVPPPVYDGGNTGNGVSGCKKIDFSICICGDVSIAQLDPIRDRMETLIIPLRKKWIPSAIASRKVYAHFVNIHDIVFHQAADIEGGERGLPHYEFMLTSAFHRPAA